MRDKPGFREAYGPYDYYIAADGPNYAAYDNKGHPVAVNTTPDIWALLNSIDTLTTAGDIYTIAIAKGSFTGSATFAPKSNTGYRFVGLANVTSNGSAEGTWLIHTGTGVAINTATHWSSPNYSYQSQHLECHYLSIVAAAASGHIIDLTNSNGWLFDSCTINGAANYASIVSGSMGIYDLSSQNGRKKVIQNCAFGCLDTQATLSVDHLLIEGWESNVYKTTGIAITSDGAPMDNVIIGAHQYQKGDSCTHTFIYDTRAAPAFSSLTNSLITLTMVNIQSENNPNGHYSSTNGAWYTDVGSADSFLMPLQPGAERQGADYVVYPVGSTIRAQPSTSIQASGGVGYSGTDIAAVLQSVFNDASTPCNVFLAWNNSVALMGSNLTLPHRQVTIQGMSMGANSGGSSPTTGTAIGTNGYQIKDDGSTGLNLTLKDLFIWISGTYSTGTVPILFSHSSQTFHGVDVCITAGATLSTGDTTTGIAQFGGAGGQGLPQLWERCNFVDARSSTNQGSTFLDFGAENPMFLSCVIGLEGTYGGKLIDFSNISGRVIFKDLNWFITSNLTVTYAWLFYSGGTVSYIFEDSELPITYDNVVITNHFLSYGATDIEIRGWLQSDTGGDLIDPSSLRFTGALFKLIWDRPFTDNRVGLTSSDGSPITLLTTSSTSATYHVTALNIKAVIYPAVFGAASTYVIKYTENGVLNTTTLTTATVNVPVMATIHCQPDSNTAVTVQYTKGSGATSNVLCVVQETN